MLRTVASVALVLLGTLIACSSDDPAASPDGPVAPNPDGKPAGTGCKVAKDCASLKCESGKCGAVTSTSSSGGTDPEKPPAPDDTIKNGDETDVDCGGAKAPKCATGKGCAANSDCTSDACSYDKKCVEFKSCTGHFGGDTCGAGETGAADAKHESCCTVVQSQGIKVGKYSVTAGRMRAFIDRFKGNLKGWAATKPKGWNSQWDDQLPASENDALETMGPVNKRACKVTQNGGGARTYWTPKTKEFSDGDTDPQELPQDKLDEKAQNCVPWHVAQALCVFDGGRLMNGKELKALRTNGGTTKWSWGNTPNFVFKSGDNPINHGFNYNGPERPTGDKSLHIPPPGRFPDGANKDGVQDILGQLLPWLDDQERLFAWTASWEDSHPIVGTGGITKESQVWPGQGSPGGEDDGYWGIGFRCVFE